MEHVVPRPNAQPFLQKLRENLTRLPCFVFLSGPKTGPPYNSWKDSTKIAGQKTVVCVAGLASSALEQKLAGSCSGEHYSVSYCSIDALALNPIKTLNSLKLRLVDGTLKDGTKVKSTASAEGSETRPVQGTAGIRTLNPGEIIPVSVWDVMIDDHEGSYNFHAFNYDWRRWGDLVYAEEVVERFRNKVMASIARDNHESKRATVIGHSMGSCVILYCLSMLGDKWTKEYIDHVILVAPAFTGSPTMIPSFAHAPFLATATWLPKHLGEHSLGDLAATWACMIAEMPTHVGKIAPWPADYVFASTPEKEYRLGDMGQFLTDLSACTSGREFGPALWAGVQKINSAMKAPPVPTHVIYSSGSDTPAQFTYQNAKDLGAAASIHKNEPGDGTITSRSITTVAEAWQREGHKVDIVECPGVVDHKDLIVNDFTVAIIDKILANETLMPISVEIVGATDLRNTEIFSKSDPYCCVEIKGKRASERKTKICWNKLNPVWDEKFTIYSYSQGDALTFTLFDHDTGKKHGDLLGVATLDSSSIQAGFDGKLPLSQGTGHLQVKVSMVHDKNGKSDKGAQKPVTAFTTIHKPSVSLAAPSVTAKLVARVPPQAPQAPAPSAVAAPQAPAPVVPDQRQAFVPSQYQPSAPHPMSAQFRTLRDVQPVVNVANYQTASVRNTVGPYSRR